MTLDELKAASDAQTVPISRGELTELFSRLYRAEGMKVEQARIHAEVAVARLFAEHRT